ncbi:uncharacterized protein LOC120689053 [Panicum virgatum]|uniref:uncharacterized protein LOC120689053 n=1 Tax=Panicum virgatum TaxID=38727 RepID=UPI0019D53C1B|nr:uncharacterized protein LOC120689053 [Panicum virgatum]
MVEDEDTRDKIHAQSLDYEALRGEVFSKKSAKENIESMSALDRWSSYGGRAIEIQRFARHSVSLSSSSSGSERNWSTFEFIHTKKRNRLLHKRLNSIVFVSYNRKMKTRFQLRRERKGKTFDPLVIEEFDWDHEWVTRHTCSLEVVVVVTLMRMVLLGSLLMKPLVHQAHYEAAIFQGMLTSVQEVQIEGWLKLTQDDDASNGCNAGGDGMQAAANIVDEFDVGY